MAQRAKVAEKVVVDALGQVIWEARRGDWQGAVQTAPLKVVSDNVKLLVTRLRQYVTKTAYQALYSILRRARVVMEGNGSVELRSTLNAACYACIVLVHLLDHGFKPSNVHDSAQYPGQTITDSSLLAETVNGILAVDKLAFMPLFTMQWQLLVAQVETNPKKVLQMMQRAMNEPGLRQYVTHAQTLPTFVKCVAEVVAHLSKGDIGNWHDLVITIVTDSLKLKQRPVPRVEEIMEKAPPTSALESHVWLGSLDLHRLTAFMIVLNGMHSFQKIVSEEYSDLIENPVPQNGVLERVFGTGQRTALLKTCIVKSLMNAREDKASSTVMQAGVLGTAAQNSQLFEQNAEVAIRDSVADFFKETEVDLGTTGLTPEMDTRARLIIHTLSCGRMYPTLNKIKLDTAGPHHKQLVKNVTSVYMGIVLADEFLFADKERTLMNVAFINSKHIQNHHAILAPYTGGMTKLIKSLKISSSTAFLQSLWEHAKAVDALVGHCIHKAMQKKSREDKNVLALLMGSVNDVLKLLSHSAPLTDRPSDTEDPTLPEKSKMCVEIYECYFPAFSFTSLPPLPVDRERKNSKVFQEQYLKAIEKRMTFRKLEGTLQRHLAVLNKTRPYTEKIIEGVFMADNAMRKGNRHAIYTLCSKLFLLRLSIRQPAVKKYSSLVPRLLRFLRNDTPQSVLVTAHALIVKLVKEPSLAAATSYAMYLNECLPVRSVPGGGKKLAMYPKLLATQPILLLQHFTMNIRAICQKMEEWDTDLSAMSEGESKMFTSDEHPSGVGLVLYTAEALKQLTLTMTMQESFSGVTYQVVSKKRRLYINALVNLLQCLNADVLTHVCAALETVFSSLSDIKEVTFWLGYTSKAIKNSENPSTKQQVVAWFLRLQSLLSPEKLGIRAKL